MHTTGGQRRTYFCPCGWGTKDSVRASDMKLRLHKKVCGLVGDFQPTAFDGSVNGINGMQFNKRGNLQYKPLIANIKLNSEIVGQCPLTEVLNGTTFIDVLNCKKVDIK